MGKTTKSERKTKEKQGKGEKRRRRGKVKKGGDERGRKRSHQLEPGNGRKKRGKKGEPSEIDYKKKNQHRMNSRKSSRKTSPVYNQEKVENKRVH